LSFKQLTTIWLISYHSIINYDVAGSYRQIWKARTSPPRTRPIRKLPATVMSTASTFSDGLQRTQCSTQNQLCTATCSTSQKSCDEGDRAPAMRTATDRRSHHLHDHHHHHQQQQDSDVTSASFRQQLRDSSPVARQPEAHRACVASEPVQHVIWQHIKASYGCERCSSFEFIPFIKAGCQHEAIHTDTGLASYERNCAEDASRLTTASTAAGAARQTDAGLDLSATELGSDVTGTCCDATVRHRLSPAALAEGAIDALASTSNWLSCESRHRDIPYEEHWLTTVDTNPARTDALSPEQTTDSALYRPPAAATHDSAGLQCAAEFVSDIDVAAQVTELVTSNDERQAVSAIDSDDMTRSENAYDDTVVTDSADAETRAENVTDDQRTDKSESRLSLEASTNNLQHHLPVDRVMLSPTHVPPSASDELVKSCDAVDAGRHLCTPPQSSGNTLESDAGAETIGDVQCTAVADGSASQSTNIIAPSPKRVSCGSSDEGWLSSSSREKLSLNRSSRASATMQATADEMKHDFKSKNRLSRSCCRNSGSSSSCASSNGSVTSLMTISTGLTRSSIADSCEAVNAVTTNADKAPARDSNACRDEQFEQRNYGDTELHQTPFVCSSQATCQENTGSEIADTTPTTADIDQTQLIVDSLSYAKTGSSLVNVVLLCSESNVANEPPTPMADTTLTMATADVKHSGVASVVGLSSLIGAAPGAMTSSPTNEKDNSAEAIITSIERESEFRFSSFVASDLSVTSGSCGDPLMRTCASYSSMAAVEHDVTTDRAASVKSIEEFPTSVADCATYDSTINILHSSSALVAPSPDSEKTLDKVLLTGHLDDVPFRVTLMSTKEITTLCQLPKPVVANFSRHTATDSNSSSATKKVARSKTHQRTAGIQPYQSQLSGVSGAATKSVSDNRNRSVGVTDRIFDGAVTFERRVRAPFGSTSATRASGGRRSDSSFRHGASTEMEYVLQRHMTEERLRHTLSMWSSADNVDDQITSPISSWTRCSFCGQSRINSSQHATSTIKGSTSRDVANAAGSQADRLSSAQRHSQSRQPPVHPIPTRSSELRQLLHAHIRRCHASHRLVEGTRQVATATAVDRRSSSMPPSSNGQRPSSPSPRLPSARSRRRTVRSTMQDKREENRSSSRSSPNKASSPAVNQKALPAPAQRQSPAPTRTSEMRRAFSRMTPRSWRRRAMSATVEDNEFRLDVDRRCQRRCCLHYECLNERLKDGGQFRTFLMNNTDDESTRLHHHPLHHQHRQHETTESEGWPRMSLTQRSSHKSRDLSRDRLTRPQTPISASFHRACSAAGCSLPPTVRTFLVDSACSPLDVTLSGCRSNDCSARRRHHLWRCTSCKTRTTSGRRQGTSIDATGRRWTGNDAVDSSSTAVATSLSSSNSTQAIDQEISPTLFHRPLAAGGDESATTASSTSRHTVNKSELSVRIVDCRPKKKNRPRKSATCNLSHIRRRQFCAGSPPPPLISPQRISSAEMRRKLGIPSPRPSKPIDPDVATSQSDSDEHRPLSTAPSAATATIEFEARPATFATPESLPHAAAARPPRSFRYSRLHRRIIDTVVPESIRSLPSRWATRASEIGGDCR
jgi:hypothetical protein